jgi:hypothetical protein
VLILTGLGLISFGFSGSVALVAKEVFLSSWSLALLSLADDDE